MKKLKKDQVIKDLSNGKYYTVICSDEEYAILAKSNKKGTRVKLSKLFAIDPHYYRDEDGTCYSNGYIFEVVK